MFSNDSPNRLVVLYGKTNASCMTTHSDHRIWQDVYKVVNQNGSDIYLKLTVVDDVLIVSFKEL
jgi:motility quorum-sensing regulator/GCU-specific mRNA interferase toxin